MISEVCPDVITFESDGDNGEYIEIYNPLDVSVNLQGWRLDWGSGVRYLTETLGPRSFLVVTDDINNENDSTPEDDATGMGSFYDVFRMLPSGGTRILVEQRGMDIANDSGRIALYNSQGDLMDYLAYDDAEFSGSPLGCHRDTLFDHVGCLGGGVAFRDRSGAARGRLRGRVLAGLLGVHGHALRVGGASFWRCPWAPCTTATASNGAFPSSVSRTT